MDKWEQVMQTMMAMPEEERMKHMKKLMGMCICGDCPTYKGTGETKILFCGSGGSQVITEEKECTCGACPVTPQTGLTRLYYCTRGNEAQQRGISM
jgi:hypothetical protein